MTVPSLTFSRLRRELFATPVDGVITLALLGFLLAVGTAFLRWVLFQAQWAVIQANTTLFAVGRYPIEQQWRLWLLTVLLAAASGLSWGLLRGKGTWPRNDQLAAGILIALAVIGSWALKLELPIQLRWWGITVLLLVVRWAAGRWSQAVPVPLLRLVPLVWPVLYLVGMVLISGGLGLMRVPPGEWGGLLLTLLEASFESCSASRWASCWPWAAAANCHYCAGARWSTSSSSAARR